MTKTWDELLAEGERLKVMEERIDAEAGNVRWLWGDLALEVAPMGADQARNGAMEKLRRFADELDISFESLRQYRTVAEKWPHGMRVPSQPWVVHQQIMGRDDREEIISNPVDVRTGEKLDRWTYRAMQRFLGQKPSPHYSAPPSSTEEKVEVAKALLDDPEVKAEIRRALNDEALDKAKNLEPADKPERTLDERWASWVHQFNGLLMMAARLAAETDEAHAVGSHAQLALTIYRNVVEREIDREIRQLLEREGVA